MKKLSILLSLLLTLGMLASCGKDKKKSNNGEVSVSGIYYPQSGQVQLNGAQADQNIIAFVIQQFNHQAQYNQHLQYKKMQGQINFTLVGVMNQYGQYGQMQQPYGYQPMYPGQVQWGGNMQIGWGQMPQQGYNPYQQQGAYGMGQIQPTAVHFH